MVNPTMIDYIHDQKRALLSTLDNKEEFCLPLINVWEKLNIKKVYLIGSGTSYHASLIIKQYFEQYCKVEVNVCIPTVFTNYEKINVNGMYAKNEILFIAISQSGTSVSTINAVKRAKRLGYCSIALTENMESLICKEADYVIHLTCGKELIPIETRGYTDTVLTGLLWAIDLAHKTKRISEEEYNLKLSQIKDTLNQLDDVIDQSEIWYDNNKAELLKMEKGAIAGYGLNYVTALEATLKLYETFHRPINGFELEEMIHGFEMAFDQKQYIFIIASKGFELTRLPLFRDFLKDLTNHIYFITCEDMELESSDFKIEINSILELMPIIYIIPFQILAARNCEAIGYDTSVYPHPRRSFSHQRK